MSGPGWGALRVLVGAALVLGGPEVRAEPVFELDEEATVDAPITATVGSTRTAERATATSTPALAPPRATAQPEDKPETLPAHGSVQSPPAHPMFGRSSEIPGSGYDPARPPAFDPNTPSLRLMGFVQAEAVLVDQSSVDELDPSTGAPLNDERFVLRRARLRLDADYRVLSAQLELDANTVSGATLRVVGGFASIQWPAQDGTLRPPLVMASLGLLKIPFGFATQELVGPRLFYEQPTVVRGLFPGDRDLGLRIQGAWSIFRYQVALMNGEPIGERSFPALDPNRTKDVLGRLGVDFAFGPVRIEAGTSLLFGRGFSPGTPSTKDVLVWRDVNENGIVELTEIQAVGGTSGSPSKNFARSALGGDLRLTVPIPVLGALCVFGEAIGAVNLDRGVLPADPEAGGRDFRERGFVIGLTQAVTEHFVLGLRYDHYDPDVDAAEAIAREFVLRDSSYSTLTAVVAWQINRQGRLSLAYDKQKNPLGRGRDGLPTTLENDALTARIHVGF